MLQPLQTSQQDIRQRYTKAAAKALAEVYNAEATEKYHAKRWDHIECLRYDVDRFQRMVESLTNQLKRTQIVLRSGDTLRILHHQYSLSYLDGQIEQEKKSLEITKYELEVAVHQHRYIQAQILALPADPANYTYVQGQGLSEEVWAELLAIKTQYTDQEILDRYQTSDTSESM
ncbi:hypothetical protein SS50377_24090 [Spironucleus salmonicida]|uniref:Uncharacterized protein n=1 Tax=Spironucleus salmonicida TaxID=348837 RepID=V6LZL0_9EUKA|nr:hypothetical protein SS50377_24083 [Spironucleus salmonicida]KAH0574144.1 hypothetical protein SS50377_24090 [Spironucleus salmonicida]|eukprot:EST46279.1 Hypothetical protein SS50377_13713 [Spironucleus salmonicida]